MLGKDRDQRGGTVYDAALLTVKHDERADSWTFTQFGAEPAIVLDRDQTRTLVFHLAESVGITLGGPVRPSAGGEP